MTEELTDAPQHTAGDVLAGRYRIEEHLGGGGFGDVYRATQLNLGREVALKVLRHNRARTKAGVGRFVREAQLSQRLEHPHTVRLYDFGQTEDGLPYIAYQLLQGRSLDKLLDEVGPLPPTRAVGIARDILKSLMEAHQCGIIHRDIKPENIFLTDFEGERDFVKVLDFGIAKPVGPGSQGMNVTAQDEVIGTPNYMAPEQVENDLLAHATDLYALGLVLSEMLTGRVVVTARNAVKIMLAHVSEEGVQLPEAVEASPFGPVIERATRRNPKERYPDAGEMLADLEQAFKQLGPDRQNMLLSGVTVGRVSASSWEATQPTTPAPRPVGATTLDPSPFDRGAHPTPAPQQAPPETATADEPPPRKRRTGLLVLAFFVVFLLGAGAAALAALALVPTSQQRQTDLVGPGTAPDSGGPTREPSGKGTPKIALADARATGREFAGDAAPENMPLPESPRPMTLPAPDKIAALTGAVAVHRLEASTWSVGNVTTGELPASTKVTQIPLHRGDHRGAATLYECSSDTQAARMVDHFDQNSGYAVAGGHNALLVTMHGGANAEPSRDQAREIATIVAE